MKNIFIIVLLFSIVACVPKFDYVKTKFEHDIPPIENILLVLDYISLKDDVGKIWDYDESYNIKQMDKHYAQIKSLLQAKGYNVLDSSLKASGLLMNSEYQAEHYLNGKLQEELISPPFIIRAIDLDDDDIYNLRTIHNETMVNIGSGIASAKKGFSYGKLQNMENLLKLELPDNTAIVVVNANRPKVSAVKAIGIGVLSVGLSGGYVVMSTHGVKSTFGYMLYPKTGDVLWTNYGPSISFSKNSKFFAVMPAK